MVYYDKEGKIAGMIFVSKELCAMEGALEEMISDITNVLELDMEFNWELAFLNCAEGNC